MKRSEISKYDAKLYGAAFKHESNILKLRHERKAESQHLDGIKKALQSKMSSTSNKDFQAA